MERDVFFSTLRTGFNAQMSCYGMPIPILGKSKGKWTWIYIIYTDTFVRLDRGAVRTDTWVISPKRLWAELAVRVGLDCARDQAEQVPSKPPDHAIHTASEEEYCTCTPWLFWEIRIWLPPSKSLSLGWGELQLGRKLVDFNIQIARRREGEVGGGGRLGKVFPFSDRSGRDPRTADLGANFSFPARLRSVL